MKAILFDWGNTLVDYPLQHPEAQQGFLKEFLTPHLVSPDLMASESLQGFLARFNAEHPDGCVTPFVARMNAHWTDDLFGDLVPSEMLTLWEQHLCDQIFQQATLFEDAMPTVRQLKLMGYKIGILSNTPWGTSPEYWLGELERHGFAPGHGLVDTAVFCGDIGYRKPNPLIFKTCVEKLDMLPHEVLMVGDSLTSDVLGAQNAGLQAAWLQRNASDAPLILGTHTLKSLETLLTGDFPLTEHAPFQSV